MILHYNNHYYEYDRHENKERKNTGANPIPSIIAAAALTAL